MEQTCFVIVSDTLNAWVFIYIYFLIVKESFFLFEGISDKNKPQSDSINSKGVDFQPKNFYYYTKTLLNISIGSLMYIQTNNHAFRILMN